MILSSLKPSPGSVKDCKRVGRGPGGGHGKTSGKGHKGQKARSGYKSKSWNEGGQMPLQRRLPKRGFHNIFRVDYQEINVGALARIEAVEVTPETLRENGLMTRKTKPIKILGEGEIGKSMVVRAHAFSASAKEKIEKAGGKTEIIHWGKPSGNLVGEEDNKPKDQQE